jgi:hypothetical protein
MREIPGRHIFSSLTRIAPFERLPFEVTPLERSGWATGDYVVGEVVTSSLALAHVELASGRMAEVGRGDLVIGVFGHREATLEVVGSWRRIGDNLQMQALTSAGLFGRATSISTLLPALLTLRYRGHLTIEGRKRSMADYVTPAPEVELRSPVVLLIGTSMNAGKTVAAKALVRLLKRDGHRVVGTKVTGAGRYRDILGMSDSGADAVFDFVDAGLASTVCDEEEFRLRTGNLLRKVAAAVPEVVVAEAGASPLEPYNGAAAVDLLRPHVRCTLLCASDPYAAAGVIDAFGIRPDLVTGVAASTTAGVRLIEKLTGLPAVNLLDRDARPYLRRLLREKLG